MFKLHHLRDFIAIAQAQSLRGAARLLGLAQPALTRSLRELEDDLGVPLVERHARGVVLTAAGVRFLQRAEAAMSELRRGRDEAAQGRGELTGTLTLAMSGAAIMSLAPYAFPHFRREFPGVKVHLVECTFPTAEPALRNGQFDFYVGPRSDAMEIRNYHCELLFHNERHVVARTGHPLARSRTLAALLDADWMVTGLRDNTLSDFEDQFAAHGLMAPEPVARADSVLAIFSVVAHSDLLAFLPQQWLGSAAFRQGMSRILVREKLAGPDIVLVSRAGLPLTPAAERFATLLRRAHADPSVLLAHEA